MTSQEDIFLEQIKKSAISVAKLSKGKNTHTAASSL
jgi:hypothetical protein